MLKHKCRALTQIFCVVAFLNLPLVAEAKVPGRLKVSTNHRYLQYENGQPFFYLGDTAWELIHRLNREEATEYLTNRAHKGFTVIQTVAIAPADGLTSANANGDLPFADRDPTKPNEAYFRHVDLIVNKAEELGMFVGLLPTWGSYWASGKAIFSATTARQYGEFLGQRYKNNAVIWILGGDRSIQTDDERAIIDALAAGLQTGDGGSHLKTYHPTGPGFSSIKLNTADWLDFNMFQSSHGAHDHDNGLFVEHDYALDPPKPTMDGEPRYEGMPVGFYFKGTAGIDRFDDYDVRQAAYWSVLAGACGHTYGNNNVWQFFSPGAKRDTHAGDGVVRPDGALYGEPGGLIGANIPWREALDHPGAFQMGFLRRLMETIPITKVIPDTHLILNSATSGLAKIRAARSSDGSFVIVYSPRGEPFTLDKSVVKGNRQREFWYDPRYGVSYVFKEQDSAGIQTFTPPTNGRGNDWVLVLEDLAAGYSIPGPGK
ncbi:MAG TPA: glycoside hydrolase family 140 protein [Pyrinomonadaceae bacterium]|nr:glycoside hydrolase family 140 protein [Pyrinomonadaceae bacterium]